ncbi:MAG: hypothetical protein ACK50D_14415, partial [Burkholderiales bacterium]
RSLLKTRGDSNCFYSDVLNPYLNFHRPCYFAVDTADAKGKIKKTYPQNQIATPFERLQSIHNYQLHLRSDVNPESLSQIANQISDNEAAKQVQEERKAHD